MIIVGVDGSPGSRQAVEWAVAYARSSGGSVRLLAAWEWPTFEGAPVVLGDYDPRKSAGQMLREVAAAIDLPADRLSTSVVRGAAPRVLLDASTEADLLVVGSRGLGGFSELVLGSVGAYCVHHSPCPVVVVRGVAKVTAASRVS
jgi:nucleotide-binding universal stress UspA family protein